MAPPTILPYGEGHLRRGRLLPKSLILRLTLAIKSTGHLFFASLVHELAIRTSALASVHERRDRDYGR